MLWPQQHGKGSVLCGCQDDEAPVVPWPVLVTGARPQVASRHEDLSEVGLWVEQPPETASPLLILPKGQDLNGKEGAWGHCYDACLRGNMFAWLGPTTLVRA